MQNYQISVGRRFYQSIREQYSNYPLAFAREALQNCIDYGRSQISIDIFLERNNTRCVFSNDGRAMSLDEIHGKLFTLGESGKEFQGTVGGFGRAKELLYFCNLSYQISTGNGHSGYRILSGDPGHYSVGEDSDPVNGTTSSVLLAGDVVKGLSQCFLFLLRVSSYSQAVKLTVEGQVQIFDKAHRGKFQRNLPFGQVFWNKSDNLNLVVVRIGGLCMFSEECPEGVKGSVYVDLVGQSDKLLTSNRDSLRYPYNVELQDFIYSISQNRKKAFRERLPRYTHFQGPKLGVNAGPTVQEASVEEVVVAAASAVSSPVGGSSGTYSRNTHSVAVAGEDVAVSVGFDFLVENEMSRQVPSKYLPGSFSTGNKKLLKAWVRVLLEVHRILGHSANFSVGFSFQIADGEYSRASCMTDSSYGRVYFLTAGILDASNSLRQKVRPAMNLQKQKDELIALAVHEVVHGLGHHSHNEDYAKALTDAMAKVLPHYRRLKACLRG